MSSNELQSTTNSIPQWLDLTFLQDHLRNYYKNKTIQVKSFSVKSAGAIGENYSSSLYRVNVTFSDSTDNVSSIFHIIVMRELTL